MSKRSIHHGVKMGHVHLKVADLERALAFYHGVLGFDVTQKMGNAAAFLCSDLAAGITGETLYVDAGYSHVGMSFPE